MPVNFASEGTDKSAVRNISHSGRNQSTWKMFQCPDERFEETGVDDIVIINGENKIGRASQRFPDA
jgi:hypothetical protein